MGGRSPWLQRSNIILYHPSRTKGSAMVRIRQTLDNANKINKNNMWKKLRV